MILEHVPLTLKLEEGCGTEIAPSIQPHLPSPGVQDFLLCPLLGVSINLAHLLVSQTLIDFRHFEAIDQTSVHRLTSGQVVVDLQTAGKSF